MRYANEYDEIGDIKDCFYQKGKLCWRTTVDDYDDANESSAGTAQDHRAHEVEARAWLRVKSEKCQ